MLVDAHHHIWDPRARRQAWLDQQPQLNRRFDLDDYRLACVGQDVTASVLVQVLASTAETEEFLLAAAQDGIVAGVIGWADLTSPRISEELARLRELPGGARLVGIRHLVQDEPGGWLARPEVRRGIRAVGAAGLCYDLLVRPWQLADALALTAELDDVPFVLDHAAKPDIEHGRLEPWSALIAELARRPRLTCKVSGLVTEAGPEWTTGELAPYVAHLIGCFTPERLMFGSDWPVSTAVASYDEVVGAVRTLTAGLSPAEQRAVLHDTAVSTYRLPARSQD